MSHPRRPRPRPLAFPRRGLSASANRRRSALVAVTVTLALLASLTAGPVAGAQQGPPPASEADRPVPEIFEPGAINRTPVGTAVPAAGGQLPTDAPAGLGAPGEVVERRTEDSRTFLTEDGKFETTFYGAPVHYRDAQGAW
jgi:hypothetical protein